MKTKNLHNQLVDWRQDLHMNPQISFEEVYASNKVSTLLKEFGLEVFEAGRAERFGSFEPMENPLYLDSFFQKNIHFFSYL